MKSFLVDTNVLFYFADFGNNFKYGGDKDVVDLFLDRKIELVLTEVVLFEFVYTLFGKYRINKEEIKNKVTKFLEVRHVIFEEKVMWIEVLKTFADQDVDLVDAYLYHKSKNYSLDLITFDKKLRKLVDAI